MQLNTYLDHTLLRPTAALEGNIISYFKRPLHINFIQFVFRFIGPNWTKVMQQLIPKNEPIKLSTVIGFPSGLIPAILKCAEIEFAAKHNVDEVDVVLNIAEVKSANWKLIDEEIRVLCKIAKKEGMVLKLIIEAALLSMDEMQKICEICNQHQPEFVKTSTGFNGAGASLKDVEFLRSKLSNSILIKASGGISTLDFANKLIEAGASRLGCSKTVNLMKSLNG